MSEDTRHYSVSETEEESNAGVDRMYEVEKIRNQTLDLFLAECEKRIEAKRAPLELRIRDEYEQGALDMLNIIESEIQQIAKRMKGDV